MKYPTLFIFSIFEKYWKCIGLATMDRHSEHVFDLQDSLSLGTGDYYFKHGTRSNRSNMSCLCHGYFLFSSGTRHEKQFAQVKLLKAVPKRKILRSQKRRIFPNDVV